MKFKKLMICILSSACASAQAQIHGYPDGPKLPGVTYSVHDPARPQPPAVVTGGALSVKPPSDAVVLFDGTSLDAWTPGFILKDGLMIAATKNVQTKQSFGAVQMHIEWKVPAGRPVNGQVGGNSGIFLMGLYEVQVLQSYQNPTYPDGQAGAMYGCLPPLVNATSPQGEWQSYDLTFEPPVYEGEKVIKPAKLTLFHNGVCLQNGESYLGPSQHKVLASYPPKHPLTGPISLQWHNDPIEFRNIWVRPLGSRP
jgi:hypothetical protein